MKPPGIAGAPTGAYTGFGIGPDAASWNADSQVTYGYDTAGRFNAVSGTALPPGGVAYSYLPASDLIERLEYKDAAGAVLAATVRSFEPGRGLLTSVENQWMGSIGVPPVTVSMYADQSDSLGRRSSVVRTGSAFATGAGASGDVKLTFAYDYRDRRVRKLVETWSGTAWQTADDLRFVYDDWNLVMELDGRSGNAILRKFSRVRCADHSGLNMQTVMRMAGHSRIETTMRYYAATTADQLELVRRASAAALAQSDPKVTQYASISGSCV